MIKKLLQPTFREVLLLLTLCAGTSFLWQPLRGQSPSVGNESGSKNKNVLTDSVEKPTAAQRGTNESPLVIDTEGHRDTPAETEEKTKEKENKNSVDAWTLRWVGITAGSTVVLMLVGIGGVIAAIRTLRAIEKQAGLMETQIQDARNANEGSAKDVKASIAEAVRSAKAMEGVAESMAISAESVKTSVGISREIADTQKLVTELQSRAYLSALFNTAIFQDANHSFEVQAILRNHGNTPAYDVTFEAVAQIVPAPIPEDFAFPLPEDAAGTSVSLIAPGTTKLIARVLSRKVPDDQVESIKRGGPPHCLAMWGSVKYRDAFRKERQLKFAFTVTWLAWVKGMGVDKDGNALPEQMFSHDTTHHNESD
jgi:hypothetical protein